MGMYKGYKKHVSKSMKKNIHIYIPFWNIKIPKQKQACSTVQIKKQGHKIDIDFLVLGFHA